MNKRMPSLAGKNDCTGCMLCANLCNKAAINFRIDSNGFWIPQIDVGKCVGCLLCEKKCNEVLHTSLVKRCNVPYKGFSKQTEVRQRSTSGGVFYELAAYAINRYNAVVFGAICEKNIVRHVSVETISGLQQLQGSKYAQSYTAHTYHDVETCLKDGRYVIFSGTPCQVEALNVFLKKEYSNLLTVDLICHGVPSYKIVERHLAVNGGDAIIQFRTKRLGWGKDSHITYTAGGKIKTTRPGEKNLFYHAFQSELCFRTNCYKCRYNNINRAGDITIGDYWAARFSKDEYDPLGISTILPNTSKGNEFLSACERLYLEAAAWDSTLNYNPRLYTSRKEYLKLSISNYIGMLYKWLPNRIADYIIEAWYSKRRHLFLLWSCYIRRRRHQIDKKTSYSSYLQIDNKPETSSK